MRSGGPIRALRFAAVLIAAAASTAEGAALAPLRPELSRTTIQRDAHDAVTVRCRGASEVVSGGFAAPDRAYAGGGPYTEILAASRAGDDRFKVKAENFSSAKGMVKAYAYCGDVGRITVAETRTKIGGRRNGTATAHCPGALTAVSGGWYAEAPDGGRPRMVPFRSKRSHADGWKVSAQNGAFKGFAVLVAQAYCADVEAPGAEVANRHMPGLSPVRGGVACPAGEEAIAGGFDAATPKGYSTGVDVYVSRRKNDGARWKVALVNGGFARHLKIYAYCA